MTPGLRRLAVTWAIEHKGYLQRRACGLVGMEPKTFRYASRMPDDTEIRTRLRALAGERRRFGHRRLHIPLPREGVLLNHKRLFRIYREERLGVRKRGGWMRALGTRAPLTLPQGPNQRWSLACPLRGRAISNALACGRRFRVLAVCAGGGRTGRFARGGRLHPRVPRPGRGHLALRPAGRPRVGPHRRAAWYAADDHQRQRHGTDVARGPALAGRTGRRLARHRAPQAAAERLRGKRSPDTSATNASTSTCSAAWPRHAGSSRHRGSTTTPNARTRAWTSSPQKPLLTRPTQGRTENGLCS